MNPLKDSKEDIVKYLSKANTYPGSYHDMDTIDGKKIRFQRIEETKQILKYVTEEKINKIFDMNNYNFFKIADGQIYNISDFKGSPDIIGIYILSLNESIRIGDVGAYTFALDEFKQPPMLEDFQYIISLDSLTADQPLILKMMIQQNKVGIKESDEEIIKEYTIINALSFDDRYKLASNFGYAYKEEDASALGISADFSKRLEKERQEILDILGISCKGIMCQEKIRNKKDYHKWLLKNHPDQAGDNDDNWKVKYEQLRNCARESKFCDSN
jgi:hypothetical protein